MINFHYELRICQKIYNRVTTHNNSICLVRNSLHQTLHRFTEDILIFFPVAVTENKMPTKSEKSLHPIPNSMIKMTDQDKSKLEAVIFEQVLESVGLR